MTCRAGVPRSCLSGGLKGTDQLNLCEADTGGNHTLSKMIHDWLMILLIVLQIRDDLWLVDFWRAEDKRSIVWGSWRRPC